jgi:hypothetical protein
MALAGVETACPSPLRTMTLQRLPRHDGHTSAVRLDSRRLRQVAQCEIGCLDKSILMPAPVYPQQARYEAISWISELCVIG